MYHSRALVWQPVYCQHGIMPNAIALDTDFAIRCSRITLTRDLEVSTHHLAFRHLSAAGFTDTTLSPLVFRFFRDSLLLESITHWSDPLQRLEFQSVCWHGEETAHHPVYAFVDDGTQRDLALRQGLQSAFAWWVASAIAELNRTATA